MNQTVQNLKAKFAKGNTNGGFTLIELLIVIAVIGVLAAIVLLAIDPLEQLKRGRDSSRKTSIGQIGRALAAYSTTHDGDFVTEQTTPDTWLQLLANAGEFKNPPGSIAYIGSGYGNCSATSADVNDFCYDYDVANKIAVVYMQLENDTDVQKCVEAASTNTRAFFAWSSENGRAGLWCGDSTTYPTPASLTFVEN